MTLPRRRQTAIEKQTEARRLRRRAGTSPSRPRSRRRRASQITLQSPIIRHTPAVQYSTSQPSSNIRPGTVDRFRAKELDGLFPCHQAPPTTLTRAPGSRSSSPRERIAHSGRHSPTLALAWAGQVFQMKRGDE